VEAPAAHVSSSHGQGGICSRAHCMTARQGLPLVHFSAQPMPFWSVSRYVTSYVSSYDPSTLLPAAETTQLIQHKVLTLS